MLETITSLNSLIIGLKIILLIIIGSTIGEFLLNIILYIKMYNTDYKISFNQVIKFTKNVFKTSILIFPISYLFIIGMAFIAKFIMKL